MSSPNARRSSIVWYRSDGLHRLTLKFPQASTEREFLRHSTDELWGKISCYGAIILVSTFAYAVLGSLTTGAPTEAIMYPGQLADDRIMYIATLAYGLLLAVVGQLSVVRRRVSAACLEIAAVLVILTSFNFAFAIDTAIWGRLKGHDLLGCVNDEALFLKLFNITVTSYVFLRVRWCLALPVQIYPIVCFVLVKCFLGIPECTRATMAPNLAIKLLSLSLTTMAASAGTYMAELEARAFFMQFIMEKTQRVESEFQLEQLQQQEGRHGEGSIPTTTSASKVLQLSGDVATNQQLAAVAELGRKEFWLIEMAELDWLPGQILGVGGFGIVTSGVHLGQKVAIKITKYPPEISPEQNSVVELCNELRVLRGLAHPNIMAFYGACVDAQFKDIALVLEMVEGVSLKEFVTSGSNAHKARILQEIATALCYLHAQNPRIVHGDLKDTNIFVQQGREEPWGAAKLLDFGLARQITKKAPPLGGSVAWMAPEVVVRPELPGTAADVFSLGRVAFFVVTGVSPGQGRSRGALIRQLRRGVAPVLTWPEINAFSCKYKDCIDGCSLSDPNQRPSILEVRQTFSEKRRQYVSQEHLLRQREELHARLQAVRIAAARWQRSATDRAWRVNDGQAAPTPRLSLGALEALVEEAAPPAHGTPAGSLIFPEFNPTPMQTQALLVGPELVRINFSIPQGACCTYHASVLNLQKVGEWLAEKQCMPIAEPMSGQCASCGVLMHADDSSSDPGVCDICGEAVLGPQ